eukprot:gnl/MRDRNA2_/MRDRNA2_74613_c0_seq1.p1 gnl/MRDRNA2_/MRDRNA2_74613_c0~~gnl/MRDRNA2_/MRDRNA2_74613_c0_seq1.p1  ORF type:complete len:107 (+),score=9.12 gnl/MRDRNA2_/MRDRNA2_74613_c0_seq1:75-395(+)
MILRSAIRRAVTTSKPRFQQLSNGEWGTTLPVPKPPPGTGVVFPSTMHHPKYSLGHAKWFVLFFAANAGLYGGHFFYLSFMMRKNPPNPPRLPEEPPEAHPHTVEE